MNAKQSTITPRRAEPTKASDTGATRRQIGEYSMFLYDLWMEANALWRELDEQIGDVSFLRRNVDKVLARNRLGNFINDYEAGRGRWADGFNAVQNALDVLERGKAA